MMSRPVAGVRNNTLIITLPGSPKGAKENLQSILKLLPHACLQAAGMDSRAMHAGGVEALEKEAGVGRGPFMTTRPDHTHTHTLTHSHTHNHGDHQPPRAHTAPSDRPPISNDPHAGASSRYRESPYPMLSVPEATRTIIEHTPAPKTRLAKVDLSLVGHVLAEDVAATEAVPSFRASIVDGYAVVVTAEAPNTKGVFKVASVSQATPGEVSPLRTGEIARITTGAPLPPGATSVVMVEDTVLRVTTTDGKEESEVEILTDGIQINENVREVGSDIKLGEVILKKGEKVTAMGSELGLLASVGRREVLVYERPRIGVLSTGDEIIEHAREMPLRLGEVRDCNRPTLIAVISGWGYEVVDLGIAKDT
jgi:gephyrin